MKPLSFIIVLCRSSVDIELYVKKSLQFTHGCEKKHIHTRSWLSYNQMCAFVVFWDPLGLLVRLNLTVNICFCTISCKAIAIDSDLCVGHLLTLSSMLQNHCNLYLFWTKPFIHVVGWAIIRCVHSLFLSRSSGALGVLRIHCTHQWFCTMSYTTVLIYSVLEVKLLSCVQSPPAVKQGVFIISWSQAYLFIQTLH